MPSGLGVDPTKDSNGLVTSGTTSTDIQGIFGGLYSAGIVNGCTVSTSPSAMTYTFNGGVVMIPVSTGKVIPAAVAAQTVTVAAGPSTGTRTDYVYVQQRFPSIEGDSEAVVNVGSSIPARAIGVAQYTVPAGATNTAATTSIGPWNYSIPYGGGLGILHTWTDTYTGVHDQDKLRLGIGTIKLPTDRLLRFSVTSLLYAYQAVYFDNSKYCEWVTWPEVDNAPLTTWNSPGLHQSWATWTWEDYFVVSAGTHTVSYSRARGVGPGSAATYYGTYQGNRFGGTTFTVTDAGIVQ